MTCDELAHSNEVIDVWAKLGCPGIVFFFNTPFYVEGPFMAAAKNFYCRRVALCSCFFASALWLLGLEPPRANGQDFTNNGFITTWLLLGPYDNPSGCCPGEGGIRRDFLTDGASVFEPNFFPKAGDEVSSSCEASGGPPCYTSPDPSQTTPKVEKVDATTTNPVTGGVESAQSFRCAHFQRPDLKAADAVT